MALPHTDVNAKDALRAFAAAASLLTGAILYELLGSEVRKAPDTAPMVVELEPDLSASTTFVMCDLILPWMLASPSATADTATHRPTTSASLHAHKRRAHLEQ